MRGLCVASILGVGLLSFVLPSLPNDKDSLLKPQDIQRVMQEITSQQVGEKRVDEQVFLGAIKAYIDQFDPKRLYLLDSEVEPYLNPKKEELSSWLTYYQRKEFVPFHRLNALFQTAILRNREFRAEWDQERASFFQKDQKFVENKGFAKSIYQLKQRNALALMKFIQEIKLSRGEPLVMRSTRGVIEEYKELLTQAEIPYLFETQEEKPLSKAAREHQFSMFVIKAFARSLDAQTELLTASQAKEMQTLLEKGLPQVGLQIKKSDTGFLISFLEKEGVAAKSGQVKVNDQLLSVDDKPVKGKEEADVYELLKGSAGSSVSLKLKRRVKEGAKYLDKTLNVTLERTPTRGEERVVVKVEQLGNGVIGTVVLNSFYRGEGGISSEKDVREAVLDLKSKYNVKGLVLDLRENSGGYLTEAIKVAGLFISNGVIATAKYGDGREVVYRDVEGERIYRGPLIVLTSKATASAAEIVAQSLQDWGVALVVGDPTTFGKGTIQRQTVTGNEGQAFFKVTVGKYYTVSGKTPQDRGVLADIVVPSLLLAPDLRGESLSLASDTIPPRFEETMSQLPEEDRSWYSTYYLPHLQSKVSKWKEMVPQLQKNSLGRLSKNKNYQWYLKQHDLPNTVAVKEEDDEEEGTKIPRNFGVGDIQFEEALNVVKDMIFIENELERGLIAER